MPEVILSLSLSLALNALLLLGLARAVAYVWPGVRAVRRAKVLVA